MLLDGIRYGYRAEDASTLMKRQNSRSQGSGEEVKRRIMLGTSLHRVMMPTTRKLVRVRTSSSKISKRLMWIMT